MNDIKVEVLHFLPGRIRFKIPALKRSRVYTEYIKNTFYTLPGIIKIRINSSNGSLLIYYHISKIHHSSIMQLLTSVHKVPNNELQSRSNKLDADWHTKDCEEVLNSLDSDASVGLTIQERHERLNRYGYNKFTETKKVSILALLAEPFKSFMGQLLLGVGVLSVVTKQYCDAIAITGIIGLEAVLGIIQGLKAKKSMDAFEKLMTPNAKVLVEGRIIKIASYQLVPGDVIQVDQGDIIPADCRLIDAAGLMVDEAHLTGEAEAVDKQSSACTYSQIHLAERNNILYMSTRVIKGCGRAVVIATGSQTEIGQLAKCVDQNDTIPTKLQRQLEGLGKKIAIGALAMCTGIMGIELLKGRSFMEVIRTGLTLAVGVIPEGLPTIVTIALAFGVKKMAAKNAIVRNLSSIENLGNATVICTDKTGTLTEGKMTVRKVYADGRIWESEAIDDLTSDVRMNRILLTLTVCNNAQDEMIGDPTETALMQFAIQGGISWEKIRTDYCRKKEIAFDAERRMMTVVCTEPNGFVTAYTKGGIDEVMAKCKWIYQDEVITALTPEIREEIFNQNKVLAENALRVLTLAYKPLKQTALLDHDIEADFIFLGLVGLADPSKPDVSEAIQKCHKVGIKVVMITGDHPITAEAIGREVGLLQTGGVITGNQIDEMSDIELLNVVKNIDIYSRTSPQHKLRIVQAFKELGYVVAMTGDGVNDAPAVRAAHIGIAMGKKGTDVTREAASITLADDNFATIVQAIEEGQNIRINIEKSLQYVLSGNFGEVTAFLLAAVSGLAFPLVPSQIILVNFITECIPVIALGAGDNKTGLKAIDASTNRSLISKKMGQQIIKNSMLTGLMTYGLFAGTMLCGGGLLKARTVALSNLVVSQMFKFLDAEPSKRFQGPSVGATMGILLSTLYVPGLNNIFRTVPLNFKEIGLVIAASRLSGKVKSVS
ncbi:MAG: hypothetical protein K0S71_2958 [Clostridia bacterium]|nr:hypothetical protein [Clostridia bacterium]